MTWKGSSITGSNNIPLGNRRRFGGDDSGPQDQKRGRSPERGQSSFSLHSKSSNIPLDVAASGERRRKKRNRWGDASENKAGNLMSLPTAIKANMTAEQIEAYALHLRIQEISEKLRINDVVPAEPLDARRSIMTTATFVSPHTSQHPPSTSSCALPPPQGSSSSVSDVNDVFYNSPVCTPPCDRKRSRTTPLLQAGTINNPAPATDADPPPPYEEITTDHNVGFVFSVRTRTQVFSRRSTTFLT